MQCHVRSAGKLNHDFVGKRRTGCGDLSTGFKSPAQLTYDLTFELVSWFGPMWFRQPTGNNDVTMLRGFHLRMKIMSLLTKSCPPVTGMFDRQVEQLNVRAWRG